MPRLLVVHHTPSPALQEMFEAAVSGARTDEIEGVEVVIRPALTAAVVDVLEADGYLLGTTANIGYMSGALKHFFDGIYYPCLEATQRRPYGLYVHGASDTGGAVRAVESIATGLGWRKVRPPVSVTGPPGKQDLEACWELGAMLAAEVAGPLGRSGRSPHGAGTGTYVVEPPRLIPGNVLPLTAIGTHVQSQPLVAPYYRHGRARISPLRWSTSGASMTLIGSVKVCYDQRVNTARWLLPLEGGSRGPDGLASEKE